MQDPIPHQDPPGSDSELTPTADHGEASYVGSGRLQDRVAIITGGDSGIGRAVAIAYAREGADVLISYLSEEEDADAEATASAVEQAGRRCVLARGDISDPAHCRSLVDRAMTEFGRLDILVNNAAFQRTYASIHDISDEEWDYTFRTNIHAMFYLAKAAVTHMKPGHRSSIRVRFSRTSRARCCSPTPPPRGRYRTSPRDWRRCSANRACG